jgi:hypothetical protein
MERISSAASALMALVNFDLSAAKKAAADAPPVKLGKRKNHFNAPSRVWRGKRNDKYPGKRLRALRKARAQEALKNHMKNPSIVGSSHYLDGSPIIHDRIVELW